MKRCSSWTIASSSLSITGVLSEFLTTLAPMWERIRSQILTCLALIGQVVATFGLPLPLLNSGQTRAGAVDSLCGCSQADRDEGRCCCSRMKSKAEAAQDLLIIPEEEPGSCCSKHKKKSHQEAQSSDIAVRWFGGIIAERCHGPLERSLIEVAPLAFPPGESERWSYDWHCSEALLIPPCVPISLSAIPELPPPRC